MTKTQEDELPKDRTERPTTSGTGRGREDESADKVKRSIIMKTICEWKDWRKPDQRNQIQEFLEKTLSKEFEEKSI